MEKCSTSTVGTKWSFFPTSENGIPEKKGERYCSAALIFVRWADRPRTDCSVNAQLLSAVYFTQSLRDSLRVLLTRSASWWRAASFPSLCSAPVWRWDTNNCLMTFAATVNTLHQLFFTLNLKMWENTIRYTWLQSWEFKWRKSALDLDIRKKNHIHVEECRHSVLQSSWILI